MLPYYARKIVQHLSFLLFLYLLLFVDPLTERDLGANVFLRMSPLSAIGAMVAAKVFIAAYWPALLILLLTIPFGRFFAPGFVRLAQLLTLPTVVLPPLEKRRIKVFTTGVG